MMTNYVKATDQQLRAASKSTYERILASLTSEVARRYGQVGSAGPDLEAEVQATVAARDWQTAAE